MDNRQDVGSVIFVIQVFIVLYVTIRFSGHNESLGILSMALFFINFIAFFLSVIYVATKIFTTKLFLINTLLLILIFTAFIVYHRSYDSYHETRRIFGGLNQ